MIRQLVIEGAKALDDRRNHLLDGIEQSGKPVTVREVLRIDPHYNVSAWQRMHCYRDDRRAATIRLKLLHAGLPDGTP